MFILLSDSTGIVTRTHIIHVFDLLFFSKPVATDLQCQLEDELSHKEERTVQDVCTSVGLNDAFPGMFSVVGCDSEPTDSENLNTIVHYNKTVSEEVDDIVAFSPAEGALGINKIRKRSQRRRAPNKEKESTTKIAMVESEPWYDPGTKSSPPTYQYPCCTCKCQFNSESELNQHKQAKHMSVCIVEGCGKSLSTKGSMRMHMVTIHNIVPDDHDGEVFRCQDCDKAFLYEFHYKSHMAAQHGGQKRYLCDYCGQEFTQVGLLKGHHLSKHAIGVGKHKCHLCSDTFSVRTTLERHLFNIHKVSLDFMCAVCGKTFKSEANLKFHSGTHSELSFKCTQCEKSFKRKIYLQRHVKMTHSGKICCSKCTDGKLYAPSSLIQHNNIKHSKRPDGPKMYTCEFEGCGRKFNKHYNMKQHLLIHK